MLLGCENFDRGIKSFVGIATVYSFALHNKEQVKPHFLLTFFFLNIFICSYIQMLKYKTVYLGIDCSNVSFCRQKLESGESNNWHTQSKWHLPRYTTRVMLLQVLTAKSRISKHGLKIPKQLQVMY